MPQSPWHSKAKLDSWMSSSKDIDPAEGYSACCVVTRGGHDMRFMCDAFARCKTIKLKRCFGFMGIFYGVKPTLQYPGHLAFATPNEITEQMLYQKFVWLTT